MKKKTKEQESWTEHLRSHRQNCTFALEDVRKLAQKCQNIKDTQVLLRRVRKEMEQIQRKADQLYEEMCCVPIKTVFSRDRLKLTKTQYWLARAAGLEIFTAKSLNICPMDDYDVYKNCVYEDDEKVFFIDPDETPNVETADEKTGGTRIRLRIACSPEETALKYFRPEQIRFFYKHRPDVIARTQKNQKSQSADATVAVGFLYKQHPGG